jgi:UDP-N-acetylglucosamine--N-acetylmuramyl-(pentapeptide) pyrophosphoryl-undecaprenol N-acetylglucosamine transferase
MMSRWATRICVSYDDTLKALPPGRGVLTGNPVRVDILQRTRDEGRRRMRIDFGTFCLLVTGASQGARSINEGVLEALPRWADEPITVIHLTGRSHYEEVAARAAAIVEGRRITYRPVAFELDMASVYAAADLVVARSGATTLAEITCRGLPSVLVPYPFAADNHQDHNARRLEASHAAVVVVDSEARKRLGDVVLELYRDPEQCEKLGAESKKLGRPGALSAIMDTLEEVVEKHSRRR